MGIALVLLSQVLSLFEGMTTKSCSEKHGNVGFLFNALISFFAMVFYIVTDKGGIYIPNKLWVYGIISGLCYGGGFYYMFLALKEGSFGIIRLIIAVGTLLTVVYGIAFLKEPSSVFTYTGIVLIFIAVILTNMKYFKGDNIYTTSKKWIWYAMLSMICNTGIGILSRMQQIEFEDKCSNEFLTISLLCSFVILLILSILNDWEKIRENFKKSVGYSVLAGAINGGANIVRMYTYLFIPISVVAPLSSGISIVIGFMASVFVYKEEFNPLQFVGMVVGILAVILLNL